MQRMSADFGEKIEVEGQSFHAFPSPQAVMEIMTYQALSALKIERLHGVTHAALEGVLDRDSLRLLPVDFALPSSGPFPALVHSLLREFTIAAQV